MTRHGRHEVSARTQGAVTVLDVTGCTRATVAVYLNRGAWDGATIAIERTIDGERTSPFDTPITLSADGMTSVIDVAGIPGLAVVVSIPSGTDGTILDVYWHAEQIPVAAE